MKFNSASDIDAIGYDRVIENPSTGETYLMRIDTQRYDPESQTPCLDQPIWQIKKVTEVTTIGITVTDIQYAEGSDAYVFIASDAESYEYKYREE